MPLKDEVELLIAITGSITSLLYSPSFEELVAKAQVEVVEDARHVGIGEEQEEEVSYKPIVVQWQHLIGLIVPEEQH